MCQPYWRVFLGSHPAAPPPTQRLRPARPPPKMPPHCLPCTDVPHWGRLPLAYSSGPRENGCYVVSKFGTEPTTLPEYERALKLDDGVIRYLITLHEHEVGAPPQSEEDLAAATRRDDDDDDED